MSIYKTNAAINFSTNTQTRIEMQDFNCHVQETLQTLLIKGYANDLCLKVGLQRTEIRCHRMILTFASEFLAEALKSCAAGKIPVLILPDIEPEIMEYVLQYVYCGELRIPSEKFLEFVDACNVLQLKGMMNYSVEQQEETLEKEGKEIEIEVTEEEMYEEENYVEEEEEEEEEGGVTEIDMNQSVVEIVEPEPEIKLKTIPSTRENYRILKVPKVDPAIIKNLKIAKLQTDGTAMINEANVPYLRERLEACIAKIFENVEPGFEAKGNLYSVKMYYCANPPKLKGIFECLMCGDKTINVCYKHKDGKFKQWINSNILRHVELSHKEKFCLKNRTNS